MGKMLSYSGLVTKIRAMKSNLLTDAQYRELAEISSVPLAVAYLKQLPAYSQIWASLDENDLHRGQIEKLLINAVYNDFTRLYRFANMEQRKFLDLYFKRYEVAILKNCLNKVFDHRDVELDLSMFHAFFGRHSSLNVNLLASSSSIEEFINNLKDTEYYKPLNRLREIEAPTLFDYETALDVFNFRTIWTLKDKLFQKDDLKQLTNAYGNKFDLLNLQWIHRSREFYQATPTDIYALLLPVYYKLKKEEITALVEAENKETFENVLSQTYYGKHYPQLSGDTLEDMYIAIMKKVLSRESKGNPYSAATIYQYLYLKDHEIRRLTVALECIRYSVPPEETISHIFKF
ncbi:MAG: V0D/AC39 family V-type ATPase subunit [Ruminococcus sp.]|jgi:V/A-type H+-transporting ATPase subunit C